MHTSKISQNFLLSTTFDEETPQNLLRVALRLAKSGKKVLYIMAKAPESLPIEEEYDDTLYRDILKNITFSYSTNAPQLIRFFLDMRQYQPKPQIIILDFLHTFCDDFTSMETDQRSQSRFINHHMLTTAALHSAVDMFAVSSRNKFISIVCIDPNIHHIYQRFIQTYIDLYFYKECAILSFNELNKITDEIDNV